MPKNPPLKQEATAPVKFIRGTPHISQWLYFQRDRKDGVGELARFVASDIDEKTGVPCWPHGSNTVPHMIMHLRRVHAGQRGPSELTLRAAFTEFREFLRLGGKIPARKGGLEKSSSPNVHRGYVLPSETVARIQSIAKKLRESQGALLARLIDAEHERLFSRKKVRKS